MKNYTLYDLIIISLLAAISIVTKPFIYTLSAIATASFSMPAGIIGGIYYMMWLILIYRIIRKPYSIILFCIVQMFLAMVINSIDLVKAFTYLPPGIIAELLFYLVRDWDNEYITNILAGSAANLSGSVCSYLLFFGKQTQPLIIVSIISMISGGLSGVLTTYVYNKISLALQHTVKTKV